MASPLVAKGNYRFPFDQPDLQIYLLQMDYAEIHYITYIKCENFIYKKGIQKTTTATITNKNLTGILKTMQALVAS